jgi:exosortase D (VPLPA-CTERM-specific)
MAESSIPINHQLDAKKPQPLQAYGILLLLALSVIAGFWPFIESMAQRWDTEDSNYCFLVVPLFLYLCWEKHQQFKFTEFSWSAWGLVAYVLAMALMVVGELGAAETLVHIGLWALLLAAGIFLYGIRLRNLWFEFLVLAFIVPLPPFLIRTLTANLKLLATSLSVNLLRLMDISVMQDGNILDIGVQQLQVVDACSGLRYVMAMFLMALLLGHFFGRGRLPQLLLLLFVLPVTIAINGFRIFLTAVLYVKGYPEFAEKFFHDFAGLALFLCAGVLLFALLTMLNRWLPAAAPRPAWHDRGGDGRSMRSVCALAALFCALVFGGGWSLNNVQAGQIIPERQTFANFPLEINGWQGQREYISEEILAQLWSDDYVKVTFSRPDRPGQHIYLLIPYYAYQKTRHTAHAPQSCLLGGGWALSGTRDRQVAVSGMETINIRTMLLQKGKSNLVAGYFFLGRGRVVVSPWMNKLYLLWDAFSQRRTDGALVRVEMIIADNQVSEANYEDLDTFILELWKILPQYIPG